MYIHLTIVFLSQQNHCRGLEITIWNTAFPQGAIGVCTLAINSINHRMLEVT